MERGERHEYGVDRQVIDKLNALDKSEQRAVALAVDIIRAKVFPTKNAEREDDEIGRAHV